jgi:NAD(P)-dependent dehydrogenase (short-subunit alcohol dehydrogenase family)
MGVALGSAGAKVALIARDQAKLKESAEAVEAQGAEVMTCVADVTDEVQVDEAVKAIVARFAQVDILINNAGINIRKNLHEYAFEEWRKVMSVNLDAAFLMCRACIPHMKGRGYGRILNMTSIMSHVSLPGRTAYSASKAGLLGMTRALAQELASEGITVVGVSPGPFATEMNLPLINNAEASRAFMANSPMGTWGKVEDIGSLALFLCSEAAAYITGNDILIDGGWTAR